MTKQAPGRPAAAPGPSILGAACSHGAPALSSLSSQGELTCQHGPAECRLNRVLACAIDQGKQQGAWFPFVHCVEGSFGPGIEDAVEGCAEQADLDFMDIQECTTGMQPPLISAT